MKVLKELMRILSKTFVKFLLLPWEVMTLDLRDFASAKLAANDFKNGYSKIITFILS